MLLRVLGTERILQALWNRNQQGVTWVCDYRVDDLIAFLVDDLVELFDRYYVEPELFRLTHAGTFASFLAVDDVVLPTVRSLFPADAELPELKSPAQEWNEFVRGTGPPEAELRDGTVQRVLSEELIENEIVEGMIAQKRRNGSAVEDTTGLAEAEPLLQVFTTSLARLLLDRLRPGRYVSEEGLSDAGAKEVVQRTIKVYRDPIFAAKYIETWSNSPDFAVVEPFDALIKDQQRRGYLQESCRILDVGCGPGQYAAKFVEKGYQVDLLDASDVFLQVAKQRICSEQEGPPKTFPRNIADEYDRGIVRDAACWDAIWCCGVLTHIPPRKHLEVLQWFHDLLKPGGCLMVNLAIDSARLFSRDGRYVAYVRDSQYLLRVLSRVGKEGSRSKQGGFRTEFILRRVVDLNTYREPFLHIEWANYFVVKGGLEQERAMGNTASVLTSRGYEYCTPQFERVYPAGEDVDVEREEFIRQTLDDLQEYVKQRQGPNDPCVLDAGCGPGAFLLRMSERGWDVYGIDVSEDMVRRAREVCSTTLGEDRIQVGDMGKKIPFEDGKFDAVLCVAAFQHFPWEDGSGKSLLAEFSRVLRPKGVLHIDFALHRGTGYDPDGRFIQGIAEDEALKLLNDAGFEPIDRKQSELKGGCYRRKIKIDYVHLWLQKRSDR